MNWGMIFVLIGALGNGADGAIVGLIMWGVCKLFVQAAKNVAEQ